VTDALDVPEGWDLVAYLCVGHPVEEMDAGRHRVAQHLRHGRPAEAVAGARSGIAEHREMNRRLAQARELQAGVERPLFVGIGRAGGGVAALETRDDRRAPPGLGHPYEPPGLAVADGGGQRRQIEAGSQRGLVDRFAGEASHVPPPREQVREAGALRTRPAAGSQGRSP
jgi:hypothetical protein